MASTRSEELNRFGAALAIVERPGSERSLLQISCRTPKRARPDSRIWRQRGKTAAGLVATFREAGTTKPLRIGSRLVVLRTGQTETAAGRAPSSSPPKQRSARASTRPRRCACACWNVTRASARPAGRCSMPARAAAFSPLRRVVSVRHECWRSIMIPSPAPSRSETHARTASATSSFDRRCPEAEAHGKFDVITANLFSEILIKALPGWSRRLVRGGYLILSGILRSQERTVVRAYGGTVSPLQRSPAPRKMGRAAGRSRTAQRAVPTGKTVDAGRRRKHFPRPVRGLDFPAFTRLICRSRLGKIACRTNSFPTSLSRPTRCANRAPAGSSPA